MSTGPMEETGSIHGRARDTLTSHCGGKKMAKWKWASKINSEY